MISSAYSTLNKYQHNTELFSAGIDKLTLYFDNRIELSSFTGRQASTDSLNQKVLIDKYGVSWRLFIWDGLVYKVIVKPTDFSSLSFFKTGIYEFIGVDNLKMSRVVRADFNLDFEIGLGELLKVTDVGYKSFSHSYSAKGNQPETLYIGKEPERFTIYDKARILRLRNTVLSRVEVSLIKKKIPERENGYYFIESLESALGKSFNPFNRLYFQDWQRSHKSSSLLDDFFCMKKRKGLFVAKKDFSSNNFNRDIANKVIKSDRIYASELYSKRIDSWIYGKSIDYIEVRA